MRVLLLIAVLALSACATAGGGSGPYKGPSSMPSHYCTYGSSFDQPGTTDVVCF
jgi:hypothetical protein